MFSFKSSLRSSFNGSRVPNQGFMEDSDVQEQLSRLQEELRKEREEKARALDEIQELRTTNKNSRNNKLKSNGGEEQSDLADRLQHLEGELEAARDSEKKMLLSLEAQTEQLEQTKVSLEEAKIEIVSLRDSTNSSNPGRQPLKNFRRRGMMSFSFADPGEVETWSLQRELKLAVESEEKCKKAMDDLAIALNEQTTEARETKAKLSLVQAELNNARVEVESLKASLESTEGKLQLALEEAERLKVESDELAAASKEKERGLVDCIKLFEEDLSRGKEENDKLIESQRVIRDENSRLREMLKHAVGEANVARESLEIARVENSRLNEHIFEKESILQSIKQEYESLKISEAAAQSSIKELKDMIDAMFSSESTKTSATASPRDAKGSKMKENSVAADDVYSDVERSIQPDDIKNPGKQKKKTILRRFGEIMKKRNS
ncbi:putative WEB family protein At1g65010, chloroplastic isoform X3 [Miscanthus floridulus]|uniref:putative WEB family protein At1g65010, chloroplastic isoform X3 n=2 Tax=Miscanthus floridulus TaxID=154761 RepID=UPI003458EFFB